MNVLKKTKLIVGCFLFSVSLPLLAMDLQEAMSSLGAAKNQGLLGEQPDGYLGVVVKSASTEEIAKLINEARNAEYQRLAKSNSLALPDVEAIAGKKAIEKTQAGQYIKIDNKWTKKP